MKRFFSVVTVCGVFAACSTSGGGGVVEGSDETGHTTADPSKVAGGQSGNDGSGSYSCDLSDPTISETPVDAKPKYAHCSPDEAVSKLSWATTTVRYGIQDPEHSVVFDCGAFGRYVVEVGPATGAQLVTGISRSDTSEETPDVPCVNFVIESTIEVRSLDGEAPFEAQRFDTNGACWDATFVAERADGAKLTGTGDIATGPLFWMSIESGTTTVSCNRTRTLYPPLSTGPEPSEPTPNIGGAGGASDPGQGGAGGEGGTRDSDRPGGAGAASAGEGGATH